MIFNNHKPIDIGYIIDIKRITNQEMPTAMYKNIEKLPTEKRSGCPAASSADKRMYQAYPPFTLDLEFGVNGIGEPFFRYNIEDSEVYFSEQLEDLLQSLIRVTNNRGKFVDMQMQLPYCFITDDKDLEVITTPPIGMQTENVFYLPGAYKPYGWIRNQNSAWVLQDLDKVGRVKFDVNVPCIGYTFNKRVNVELKDISDDIKKFSGQNTGILRYKFKLGDTYKTVLSRRPKKLL
jgi:hypothetical protein